MGIKRLRRGGVSVCFVEGHERLGRWLLEQPEVALEARARSVEDRFATSKVSVLSTPHGEFVLKRFERRLGGSKAFRELRNGQALLEAGVDCVVPVALLRFKHVEFLLSPHRSDLISGINLVWGGLWEELNERRRREVISTTAALVARLHNASFTHGDLNSSNILFENLFEGNMRAYLVDLAGIKRATCRRCVRDVARLWRSARRIISPRQGLRFLVLYCRLTKRQTHPFLEAVARRVRYLDKHRPQKG